MPTSCPGMARVGPTGHDRLKDMIVSVVRAVSLLRVGIKCYGWYHFTRVR